MRSLLTLISLLISVTLTAQAPKEKWGNATMEELTMTSCSIDPAASAAILDNYGHYYFNRYYYYSVQELRTFYHYQVRLKIFTEEGKRYATITIPYHGFDEYEDVTEITGYTYNLVNGNTVKTKMKQKNIRWQKNGRGVWYCTFTLPDVKPGSVIEYSYKIASLDFARLKNWMFQDKVPVLHSDMVLTAPNFYQFAFFSNMPQGNLTYDKRESYVYLPFYTANIYCNATELHLKADEIPAFKKEEGTTDSSQVILKGEFLLVSAITRPTEFNHLNEYYLMPYLKPLLLTTTEEYYEPMERIRLYNETIVSYKIVEAMDWPSLVKSLGKRNDFGKNMIKAFECKWLIDSFRKAGEGRQRMIAVYDYVRRTMKWNGEYRIFASNSPEKIFEKKTGYSSDINFQLINLLSRSGIPARPVLLSTRSNGPVYKELGFLRKFNHVIVSVELDGTRYLLDATDPNRPYNLLSTDDLNGEGLLVNLFEFQWVPLVNNGTTP
jgi:hypothetical protein